MSKKNPLFASALALCALVAVGESWCVYERWRAADTAKAKLVKKQAELQAMAGLAPAPTREVATAIESDLARARKALATMQGELTGHGPAADRMASAKVPTARTDAFFDLATFIEKMRDLAKKQDVDVQPTAARFGFVLYANAGPEAERIAAVFQQRQVAQYLLESLFEARPRALVSVQREKTFTKTEREAYEAAVAAAAANGTPADATAAPDLPGSAEPDNADLFTINPRASARTPGYIDTLAFQLVFVGQTSALRTFLNKLASFELPVLVREVEVEPSNLEETVAPTEDAAAAGDARAATMNKVAATGPAVKAPAAKPTAAPIVAKPLSKFTVTVEYVSLVNATPPATDAAPGTVAKPSE